MVARFTGFMIPTLIITRREVRDLFRDWRIIFPILFLTLIFPGLMNFTAYRVVDFVQQYGASLIATRFIPFLLMIVGFFPITVSLVIALESFAGETERRSIEPLLSSPLSDWQLYLGKLLASLIPPVVGSCLGIVTYLVGVYRSVGWSAEPIFLFQIILLTTVQAIVMVSGAVVVSTQTTSVRAANLLSSFIVIPMSLLIQGEAIVMFWGGFEILWLIILGQIILASMLIRIGIAHFNREELLGREIDVINLRKSWRVFKAAFIGKATSFKSWLFGEVGNTLRNLLIPILFTAILLPLGIWLGADQAHKLDIPPELLNLDELARLEPRITTTMRAMGFYTAQGALTIWLHNLRAVFLATFLGIFTFGVLGVLILMAPWAFLGFFAQSSGATGVAPLTFLAAFILPHGLLELPAMILTGAAILRVAATLVTPAQGSTISEAFLRGVADWAKIMVAVIIPLFFFAAILEVFLAPQTMLWLLGK